MTIPEESIHTQIQDGDGGDSVASVGDAGVTESGLQPAATEKPSDGADGHDVGQATLEPSPRDVLVEVPIEDGSGAAMLGLDIDSIDVTKILNGTGDVAVSESHTVGITRITVTESNIADGGRALVAVTPKQ